MINTGMIFYRETTYAALRLAEQEKGGPVILPDVVRAYRKISKFPLFSPHMIFFCLWDYYWNDQILADKEINRYTTDLKLQHTDANPTGFDLYSDRITRVFPGYTIDQNMRVRPGPETPLANFD